MAGIRQHYLPQFLQRPFASPSGITWVFRKNGSGIPVSTKNIGLEKSFYTEVGDTLVDDVITAAEPDFSRALRSARDAGRGPIAAGEFPRLLAHLEVRSRHLRRQFVLTSHSLHEKTVPILSNPEQLERLLSRHIAEDPTILQNAVRERLEAEGISPDMEGAAVDHVRRSLPGAIQELAPEFAAAAANVLAHLRETLERSTKEAHIKALTDTIAPQKRIERYNALTFRVEEVPHRNMILGDSAVLFHVDGPTEFKPMTEPRDALVAAVLPLGPERLLIGTVGTYEPDFEQLRTAAARCALEFFIAHDHTPENAQLAKLIGADAALLKETEIQRIADEALNQAQPTTSCGSNEP